MNLVNQLITTCGVILVISFSASAQGWHGIVPLRSSCEDVKRLLQTSRCQDGTYPFTEGTVTISFSDGTCRTGWNVPPGTVLAISVHSRTTQKLSDTFPDLSKYVKSFEGHVRYVSYYKNEDEGVSIAVFEDGTIAYVSYVPSLKDSKFRCPANNNDSLALPTASKKFDEFGVLATKDEELRLNDFATELKAWTTVDGYIVAYSGRRDAIDGLSRAARIKAYLVKQGVAENRLVILNSGSREDSTVELYLVIK